MVPALRHVRWTRFWSPLAWSIHIEPGGYLIDPEGGEHGKVWNPSVEKLERRFGAGRTRSPLVTTGAIASSDRLLKDAELLQVWLRASPRRAVAL